MEVPKYSWIQQGQKDPKRMNRNILGSTVEVPDMVLLIKDHKLWSLADNTPVPSRPVVSGSRGINTHLSEWISEFLEPIALEMSSGEISSTEEALAKLDKINDDIKCNLDTPHDDIVGSLVQSDDIVGPSVQNDNKIHKIGLLLCHSHIELRLRLRLS